jgi:hypothetical protein
MRLHSLAIRIALPLAVIGMTAVGAATPALAEAKLPTAELPAAEPPKIELVVPDKVVTTSGGSKTASFEIINVGKATATGLTVGYATNSGVVDPQLGFQPPQGCTATGCTVGDLAAGARKAYTFTVKPTAQLPEVGGSFRVTVRDAGGAWEKSATVHVARAAQGIDLEVARIPEIKLAAGQSAVLPISVRNNGNKATKGVAIALASERHISFANNYSNCEEIKELGGIVCAFDLALAPGAVFTMSPTTPLTVKAVPAAPGPADYNGSMHAFGLDGDTNDASLAAAKRAAKKPGKKLELVPALRALDVDRSELNEFDNATSFVVKVALNPADTVAIGDNFTGKIGDTRTVKIGFRNDGPATVLGPSPAWTLSAKVRLPSGLKVTKVDKRCFPNSDGDPSWEMPGQISGYDYLCLATKQLAPGDKELFSFSAKINDGENEDEGSITVIGGVQDQKAGNNTAKVEVKLTTANGGGSGGSGGGLPITGAPAGQTAVAGLLLMLAGAMALVLTRPRPSS